MTVVGSFELQIPALPAYVGTARAFAASLGRAAGIDQERVDDLVLAVSEACAEFLPSGEVLRLRASPRVGSLTFEIGALGNARPPSTDLWPPEDILRLDLIRALMPGADEHTENGRRILAFSAALPPTAD